MYWKDGGVYGVGNSETQLNKNFYIRYSTLGDSELDIIQKYFYWQAIKKFPSPNNCTDQASEDLFALDQFKWSRLLNEYQLQVCLHHITSEVKDVKLIQNWLNQSGFDVDILPATGAKDTVLSGIWRKADQPYPFSIFSTWRIMEIISKPIPIDTQLTINLSFESDPPILKRSIIKNVIPF